MKRALLVIAKVPAAGETKTRLTPYMSPDVAAGAYEALLRDALEVASSVDGVEKLVLYSPAGAKGYFHTIAPGFRLLAQEGATLGQRLDRAILSLLDSGFDHVVIVSSDTPLLTPSIIVEGFSAWIASTSSWVRHSTAGSTWWGRGGC